ncbi:hypothetical protein [Conexibacter sp. SYSU D00693]|uniref:hypothetical protein n=1 Tax=Conexibacter sp. SYSU D00693 TaxID=2812560 RepID=UPI00196AEFA2|nr:hypothetical protein [Conexibacter sp. SYSU D00693]
MTRRLRQEEGGWALVTAIGLLAVLLALGLATFSQVDAQQQASGMSRQKESAFNAAEAALSAQIFALAQDWPGRGRATAPYVPCTQASVSPRCPSADSMAPALTTPDARRGVSWTTSVRDNGTGATRSFYDDALTASAPGYDADGDGRLWVRAQARVAERTRTVVALVRVEELQEELPQAAIITGRLQISNNGNKVIVDGSQGSLPTLSVRCTPQALGAVPCLGHGISNGLFSTLAGVLAKLDQQLAPNVTATGYDGGPALEEDAHERLKRTAIADGAYFATCPSTPPSGRIVWIAAGTCTWTGNQVVNSAAAPGLLVLEQATLYLGGTVDLHAIVYAPNPSGRTDALVQVQGNARVIGGVLIDGPGTLVAGSSKLNVQLSKAAYDQVRSYASAGMIQNTWREIVPAS